MKKQLYIASALLLTSAWVLPAQSTILFQTTTPPSAGAPTGGSISTTQYLGNYFVLTSAAHVDSISTAASASDGGTIFAAILAVPNLASLPSGTPFGTIGTTSAPLVTTTLKPNATNSIVSGNAPVDLAAGTYIVVFGTGQFGATAGTANLAISDGAKPSLPAGSNQVSYGPGCNNGTTVCWSSGFGAPSPYYFAVSGSNGQSSITSLNPNFAAPGGQAFSLTVNGSGFVPTSTIAWNGTTLATTYFTSTQLTAVVPASFIATTGSAAITVTTNAATSAAATFTIGASTGPTISSINPTTVLPGSGGFNLTVNGSGFISNAIIQFGTSTLITNFNSSTQLTASVGPAFTGTAGTYAVTVQNPNGSLSNTVTLTIGQPSTIPTLTTVAPNAATVGGPTFMLALTGTNFTTNAGVTWNNILLPTTYVSPTQLTASVNSTLLASAGTANITVTTSGGTSNTLSFPIVLSTNPAISSLNPTTIAPGSAAFTLTIAGSNFTSGSGVFWNTTLLAPTFVNSTQLSVTVPATLVASSGTANITVVNSPGNVTSNAQVFTVSATPPPVLSSLSPSSTAPGGAQFTLTVTGSNFVSNSVIQWNGNPLATTLVSATQMTGVVTANLIAGAGTASVTVTTPNGGTSSALTFTIAAPTGPNISSLSPASATPGSGSFILMVNGSAFTNASKVQWNGSELVTGFGSSTQLTASVSNTLIATAGTANVTVVTGTTVSNAVAFTIGAPNTPILISINPTSATVGNGQFTLTANGSNFVNGATVVWNGGLLSTTFVNASQLTAVVPASLIAAAGTANVTVNNPSGTATTSNALTFTVAPASSPTISSLGPATTNAGGAQFTINVNGQGFLTGATVRWNGSALSTTFVNASQLTAVVPASLIASPGTATITVANQGGAFSNSLLFTITSTSTSNTIFQTTLPPTLGQLGSASLSSGQFLGNYFVLTSPARVDSISTYAQASDNGTIFGAILSVPSLTAPPTGSPFDGSTIVSATLRPGSTSGIVTATFPPVDLPAGTYAIVFGSGYFGATSTTALAAFSNGLSSNVPLGWNQVSWGFYCGGGLTTCWSSNFAAPSQFYFAVTGTSVTTPALTITSLNPAAATAGGSAFTLTITGTGFGPGSTAKWNGTALATNVISGTQLNATVTADLIASTGAASITVINAVGAISNATMFTVSSAVSSITSLNPPSATAGGPAFTLTINGTGFANGSTLQWNGQPLTTTYVNPTQLAVNVPATLLAIPGSASLTVLSPGGQFSNFLTFTVGTATPSISSLNPNSTTVGSAGFTMLVTGSGFLNGSTVLWNGSAVPTSYVGATQLSAIVSQALLANVGTYNITVQNPNGTTISNVVAFTVAPVGGGSGSAGLAHYAVGSNWTTGLFIVNTGSSTAQYAVSFFDDNGNPTAVPFASGSTTRLIGTLPAYGSVYLEAANPAGALTSGWGQISADSSIVIQSLFRSTLNNTRYEAAVPSSTGSRAFELPFDATNFSAGVPLYTGIAIANLDSANVAQISCIARDGSGNLIANGVSIPTIRPLGHWAGFQFPGLVGQRGTLDCVSTTSVAVIALRFIGTDTFSSLPVIKK